MPMHQRSTLLDHFPGSELLSFAIRKALSATREKVIFLDGFNLGTVGARMQFNGGTHGNRIAPGTIAMLQACVRCPIESASSVQQDRAESTSTIETRHFRVLRIADNCFQLPRFCFAIEDP